MQYGQWNYSMMRGETGQYSGYAINVIWGLDPYHGEGLIALILAQNRPFGLPSRLCVVVWRAEISV